MTVRFGASPAPGPLAESLLRELSEAVGADHVETDGDALTEAGQDWWPIGLVWVENGNQPAMPQAVVAPGSTAEVAAVLKAANSAKVPVTPFGGRSGVVGGSLPVAGGISLDLRRLDKILEIDDTDLVVHTQTGVFGPELEASLSEAGLTCGHFPQSFDIATVGGWIACRGAGQFSNKYGKIEDLVLGLEVVLADGTAVTYAPQPAAATGPDLKRLFIGAEGTLGVVTSAWLQAHPAPATQAKRAYSFETFKDILELQRRVARRGATPACLRGYDTGDAKLHFQRDDDSSLLIVIAEGDAAEVGRQIQVVDDELADFDAVAEDEALAERWLENRNDVSALHEVISRGVVVDTIEIAAPWSKLPAIYSSVRTAVLNIEGTFTAVAHASHAYLSGGCLYFTFAGTAGDDPAAKDAYYNDCWETAMRAVIDGGGTISHHHGIGLNRARFMREELGDGFAVLEAVKDALDPNGIMNPAKLGLGTSLWPGEQEMST